MKVHIRFLRQGLVEAETPKDFKKWDEREKMLWANERLARLSDTEVVRAMADWDDVEDDHYFDEGPSASAIEVGEGEEVGKSLVATREWSFFKSAAGLIITEDD